MKDISEMTAGQDLVEPAMIKLALDYWLNDHEEVRSPFPQYIHEELPPVVIGKYVRWINSLADSIRETMKEEMLMERFEEMLFDEAYHMVQTDDEKITVRYPFMMRVGDKVREKAQAGAESTIIRREIKKNGDEVFLKVRLRRGHTGEEWDTSFELPE
jgi:hypothetical protein